jgi:hypothetical protein
MSRARDFELLARHAFDDAANIAEQAGASSVANLIRKCGSSVRAVDTADGVVTTSWSLCEKGGDSDEEKKITP